jgi:transposase
MKDEPLHNNIVSLHAKGWSIHRLSDEFGISRGRVRRIIMQNDYMRQTGKEYKKKPGKQGSKLDAWKEYIGELLETYQKEPPTNQRIFELIKEKGYNGGITILRNYLVKVRAQNHKEPLTCIETPAGQRASHDWSEYNIEFTSTGRIEKVIFFSLILNYSRRQYIEITENKTQPTLLESLVHGFMYFDGVPLEIKSDNQKACVDRWEQGKPIFNTQFLTFASHYRFRPLAIHPGKPRENLKVERPFYYLETNFLNARRFYDKNDLKEQLKAWLTEQNDQRIHRTTKRKPIELYMEELPFLQALPTAAYDTSTFEMRIVNNESCIQWKNHFYHVPAKYMYQTLAVRIKGNEMTIYSPEHEQVKQYEIAPAESKNRYVGCNVEKKPTQVYIPVKEVIGHLKAFGPIMQDYINQIIKNKPTSYRHHLQHILSMKVNYHKDDILTAIKRAIRYKIYESGAVENFLKVNAQKKNEFKLLDKNSENNAE